MHGGGKTVVQYKDIQIEEVSSASTSASKTSPPNVVFILADDMGYSDLGCYGGEISTPHLDGLAKNGLRFTQFYNTARCWPTRGALLTGYYAQQIHRDALPTVPGGGQGVRQEWAKLLPELLKSAGYRSYHSGKWHIDGPVLESGFARSLDVRNQGNFFTAKGNSIDDVPVKVTGDEAGYYVTTGIADHAIDCLQEHAATHAEQPFFQYIAFIAPHFPLHALPEDIAKYRDRYLDGWKALREQRYARQKKMGLINTPLSEFERDLGPPYDFPEALKKLGPGEVNRPHPWDELTDEQRRFQATKMAIHAAMVDRMDQEIGRYVAELKSKGLFDNTLIFFGSDNGASAEIMVRNGGHDPTAEPGSAATYLCLGPGFSSASNTPFRRHKTWVHEGGISTPLIVSWPAGIEAKNELRHTPAHVIDFVPTILELAGIEKPTSIDGEADPACAGAQSRPGVCERRDHRARQPVVAARRTSSRARRRLEARRRQRRPLGALRPERRSRRAEQPRLANARACDGTGASLAGTDRRLHRARVKDGDQAGAAQVSLKSLLVHALEVSSQTPLVTFRSRLRRACANGSADVGRELREPASAGCAGADVGVACAGVWCLRVGLGG